MQFQVLVVLACSASAICATVGEFPFDTINNTDTEDNFTNADEFVGNFTTEFEDEAFDLDTESVNEMVPTERDQAWTAETSPLFRVIRDFLFQARDGLIEPLEQITEGPIDEKTEQLIRVIEHGLVEATTILMSQMEGTTFPTVSSSIVDRSPPIAVKRKGETRPETAQPTNNVQIAGTKNKRQTAFDMIANTSTSCSDCYDDLQMCVQKCFARHNCNDIQRSARTCPPTPSRLCNPFTPWNPVDECKSNEDCGSPLLCCNDGCINKCVPGVWRS